MRDSDSESGKSIILTWEQPFILLPGYRKRIRGWSIIWLWFGLHFISKSGDKLIDDSEFIGTCNWCPQEVTEENSVVIENNDARYRVCNNCVMESRRLEDESSDIQF